MTFKTEFPDFPASDMPALPEGFSDTSWHNDECPSYSNPSYQIWIDYVDPSLRAYNGKYPRFNVQPMHDGIEITGDGGLMSDNWSEVLEYITDEATLQSVCAKLGLSIITDTSEPRCGVMYHVMQGDHRIKLAYDKTELRDFILSKKEA